MNEQDFDNLTDEEVMNMTSIPDSDQEAPIVEEPVVEAPTEEVSAEPTEPVEPAATVAPAEEVNADADGNLFSDEELAEASNGSAPVGDDTVAASENAEGTVTPNHTEAIEGEDKGERKPDGAKTDGEAKPAETPEPVDFESAYTQIMAPFKANGREFTPSSPDEVIRLMQMGTNYTKKMQELKPNLKLMRMLENNGLMDQDKLSFLIDVDKKDPAALQKLLHDGAIDPMDLDTSSEPTYRPGNHSVSDHEHHFHETLGDVTSTQEGKDTVNLINSQWDQASKEAVYKEPELLGIIRDQRASGIYAKITTEVERRRTLGELDGVSFINAYKTVGDHLQAQGSLAPAPSPTAPATVETPAQTPAARVLEVRTGTPKPVVKSDPKARAASASRASAPTPPKEFNPFDMTDDEIMALPSPTS